MTTRHPKQKWQTMLSRRKLKSKNVAPSAFALNSAGRKRLWFHKTASDSVCSFLISGVFCRWKRIYIIVMKSPSVPGDHHQNNSISFAPKQKGFQNFFSSFVWKISLGWWCLSFLLVEMKHLAPKETGRNRNEHRWACSGLSLSVAPGTCSGQRAWLRRCTGTDECTKRRPAERRRRRRQDEDESKCGRKCRSRCEGLCCGGYCRPCRPCWPWRGW